MHSPPVLLHAVSLRQDLWRSQWLPAGYLPGEHCLLHGVECKFAKPIFIGDTLTITGTVVNVSEAVAEAEIKAVITNQDGKRVTRGIIKAGLAK